MFTASGTVEVEPLTEAQRKFVEDNSKLVYYVVNKFISPQSSIREDAIQHLFYRLCRIALTYRESKAKPSSYIVPVLKFDLINYFRGAGWFVRVPRSYHNKLFKSGEYSTFTWDEKNLNELNGALGADITTCMRPLQCISDIESSTLVTNTDLKNQLDYLPKRPWDSEGVSEHCTSIENTYIEAITKNDMLKDIFGVLTYEERVFLALRMKGKSIDVVAKKFNMPLTTTRSAWCELQAKVKGLYSMYDKGLPLPVSKGNRIMSKRKKV